MLVAIVAEEVGAASEAAKGKGFLSPCIVGAPLFSPDLVVSRLKAINDPPGPTVQSGARYRGGATDPAREG